MCGCVWMYDICCDAKTKSHDLHAECELSKGQKIREKSKIKKVKSQTEGPLKGKKMSQLAL